MLFLQITESSDDTSGQVYSRGGDELQRQCEKTSRHFVSFTDECVSLQVKQMFQSSNIDAAGNLDYKSLCYIITHGEEQEE